MRALGERVLGLILALLLLLGGIRLVGGVLAARDGGERAAPTNEPSPGPR